MSRSVVVAILAFSILILANLALFGFLSFGPLSKKMVTERLVQELNDARSLMKTEFEENPLHHRAAKKVAPMLRRYEQIEAILLLDSEGRVIHRQRIHEETLKFDASTSSQDSPSPPKGSSSWAANMDEGPNLRHQNVLSPSGNQQAAVALEYDSKNIENEVNQVRKELFSKLLLSLTVSIVLLISGGVYVIHAYKRNKVFEQKARKADKMAYVGTLAAGLAHEIRNPLNSMNMNLQLIREEILDMGLGQNTEIQEMFNGTSREINRLSKLVTSFLAYARPTQLVTKVQNINALIRDIIEFVDQEIQSHGVILQEKLGADLPDIPIDEPQLRQALLNVFQNAIQVLSPGKKLLIETRLAGTDNLIISVEDEGPGIAPDRMDDIMKVFYSTKKGGTGLGLPIAQRIAEQHGGGLKIESKVGQGTKVIFILPIAPKEESA